MVDFEEQLWAHLVEEHGADRARAGTDMARRRAPRRLATAGASGVAAIAIVVILVLGATSSTPPAYALSRNGDGTVTITLNNVERAIPGLNAEFARLGVREKAVPMYAGCTAGPSVGYIAPSYGHGMNGGNTTLTVGNKWLLPGYTGFIAARQVGPDKVELAMGALNTRIPPCFPDTTMDVVATQSP